MTCKDCIFLSECYQEEYPFLFCLVQEIQEGIDDVDGELIPEFNYLDCECFIPHFGDVINGKYVSLIPPFVFDVDTEWAFLRYGSNSYLGDD